MARYETEEQRIKREEREAKRKARERAERELKIAESRKGLVATASLKADENQSYMDVLHQMAFDHEMDELQYKYDFTVKILERSMADDQVKLDKWGEDFKKNPAYAFEWGDGAVEAATRLAVTAEFLAWFRGKGPVKALAYAKGKLLQGAVYPSRSTSQCHNLTALYTTAAWAKLVDERERGWTAGF